MQSSPFSRFAVRIFSLVAGILLVTCSAGAQTLDTNFNPGPVSFLALQPPDKILVWSNGIHRIDYSGAPDPTFTPVAVSGSVSCLALQEDGKILVAGAFSAVNGESRSNLARLYGDGGLDANFAPQVEGAVEAMVVQPDARIVVAGRFSTLNGEMHTNIGRFNADGTVDSTFNASSAWAASRWCLALQTDGKILLGNTAVFYLDGESRYNMGRLNPDGTIDQAFNPGDDSCGTVMGFVVQPNGNILVYGNFDQIAGSAIEEIARVNDDGSLDTNFTATAVEWYNTYLSSAALDASGRVLIGGNIEYGSSYLNLSYRNFIRLNPDRSLDDLFSLTNQGYGYETSLAIQTDGKVLAGMVRLYNTTSVVGNLSFDDSTITWLRGGASPEVWRTKFAGSTNGVDWTDLGSGTRIPGGWQLTGGNYSAYSYVRARGFATGGYYNSSSWYVESFAGPPLIMVQPVSCTNIAGTDANFSAVDFKLVGQSYRWRKDGVDLEDDPRISGANTPLLRLTNVLGAAAGEYSLVISNSFGSVTSAVATLTVVDPCILSQPLSQTNCAGFPTTLAVSAAASAGSRYQWYKNGSIVSGATGSSIFFAKAQRADSGDYYLIVSNSYGSAMSGVANLTILDPWIGVQPVSQTHNAADKVVLGFTATTTAGTRYQWYRNGAVVAGATRNSVTFTNVQWPNNGDYCAVVSNIHGCVTSSVAALTIVDPWITTQPSSQQADVGQKVAFNVVATTTAGTRYQWYRNDIPLAGATRVCLTLTNAGWADIGTYYVVVSNAFGRLTSDSANLMVNMAALDGFNPNADDSVYCLTPQSDGRIISGGSFWAMGGLSRGGLARLQRNGALDLAFNPAIPGVTINCAAIQPDGRILIGGAFNAIAGTACTNLARLNPSGTLDTNFNGRADGPVHCLLVQPDGGILIGGRFSRLGGALRQGFGRLNADGTVDERFGSGVGIPVYGLAIQSNRQIVIVGGFGVARLTTNGVVDPTFRGSAHGGVSCVAIQADDKIVLGGEFSSLCEADRWCLGRLNSDGTLDQSFSANADTIVRCLAVVNDGEIVIGGDFSYVNDTFRYGIAQLTAEGVLKDTFNVALDGGVRCLAVERDGAILFGGDFASIGSQIRDRLARLKFAPSTEHLTYDGAGITWLRGGQGPEVWGTTFDVSTNGFDWVYIGDGTRIPGGWELRNVTVASDATIRARGFVSSGNSSWFVESSIPAFAHGGFTETAKTDILWQREDGKVAAWAMDGTNCTASAWLCNGTAVPGWRVFGQGDFNGDGKVDVVFQNNSTRKLYAWFMDGTNRIGGAYLAGGTASAAGWSAVSSADFNGDHWPDILFQDVNRRTGVWLMKGTTCLGATLLHDCIAPPIGWRVAATADFDGDSQTDIIWQHSGGSIRVWHMWGFVFLDAITLRTGPAATTGWRIAAAVDFSSDGKPDLLWQNVNTGQTAVWFCDNDRFLGSSFLRAANPQWRIVGPR